MSLVILAVLVFLLGYRYVEGFYARKKVAAGLRYVKEVSWDVARMPEGWGGLRAAEMQLLILAEMRWILLGLENVYDLDKFRRSVQRIQGRLQPYREPSHEELLDVHRVLLGQLDKEEPRALS